MFAGWRIFLESLAERRPLVLVIDDLQWADDGLLDFVDGLVDLVEGVPLLVVACARPELLERRPDWGGGQAQRADCLARAAVARRRPSRLVESLLGRDPADEELREAVVERAAGNPLYAEEFVRMQTAGGDVEGLPDSVLGIVTARVDLLPPAEKELLRDAAVMGGVVWSDGLRAVSEQRRGRRSTSCCGRSGARSSCAASGRSAVVGATQHAFVHTLVRDAVYGQLPRPDRVDRHVRVARWIESLPDDRREDRAELLAHHYLEAIELARSAGLDVSELEPKAATALREAGMRAFAIGAFPPPCGRSALLPQSLPDGLDARALRALGKALVFTENAGQQELQVAFDRLLSDGATAEAAITANDLSHAHWRHGEGAEAAAWTARALELVAGTGPTYEHVYVLAQTARHKMVIGNQESVVLADEAIALAEAVGAHAQLASALITRATAKANAGDYGDVRKDFDEAAALARDHDPSEIGRVHINLGSILLDLGDVRGAIAAAREGVAFAQKSGTMGGSGVFVLGNLTEALFQAGEWNEAESIATARLAHAEATGAHYHEPTYRAILAELGLVRDGQVEQAAATARLAVDLARDRGDDQVVLPIMSHAAWILARTGDHARAAGLVDELLERRRSNPKGVTPGVWTTMLALALEQIGRPGALETLEEPPGSRFLAAARAVDAGSFGEAAETLCEIGAPQLEAEARVLAARASHAAADAASADAHLARARELLEALSAVARLRDLDGSVALRSRSGER